MIVVAKIKVRSGTEGDAEAALRKHVDFVAREEPGTLSYVLHRSRRDPATFLVYERYADEAAFDLHGKSSAMQELFARLQPWLDGPPSIDLYDRLAG